MIYLDNAATSKPYFELLTLFNKLESDIFANAQSHHKLGLLAQDYLKQARTKLLKVLNVENSHIPLFVSSATEANNLALKGYALKYKNRGNHIILSNIEHPSVMEACLQLKNEFGFELTILYVNSEGVINLNDLEKALKKTTILVSIMAVNNEIGSINPIKEIAQLVHKSSLAALHVDVTQAIGKVPLDYSVIDMFSFSGHKINGLKGSGALIIRKNISLLPLFSGGNQEFGFRSATSSVALNYTLAEATFLSIKKMNERLAFIQSLNDLLRHHFANRDDLIINSPMNSSPFIFNFSLLNKKASVVVEALSNEDIFVSSFSACQSNTKGFSYVVKALGRNEFEAQNTVRISFDYHSTKEDVLVFIQTFKQILQRIKR